MPMRYVMGLWICLMLSGVLAAQTTDTDDIQVNAVFKPVIDLRVTGGASINFLVATLGEYEGGVSSPFDYFSDFDVSSSVNFQVMLSNTPFLDEEGRELDSRNVGFRIQDNGTYQAGVNHLLLGQPVSPSALAVMGTPVTLVSATGSGNAGNRTANAYRLHFELGTPDTRAISGLTSMLEQRIAPSTYTSVVTLTASAMP
ncbi:MAG: hypothetical protein SF053_17145 [Bacteroidia bacterium]|nr:hypothetical protein [Bacteroidia bacterium]